MTAPHRPEPLHVDEAEARWREVADALSEDVGPWPVRRVRVAEPHEVSSLGLVATILAIALAFALSFWVASKLAEGAALAPRSAPVPTVTEPSASGSDVAPGGAGSARALGDASGPGLSGAPELATTGAPPVAIAGTRWAGTATFYCATKAEYPPDGSLCTAGYQPGDLVAAIDSDLGIPEGTRVIVRSQAGDGQVTVRIVDVCDCPGERLIDLTAAAFKRLAPLDYGVIPVTIELAGPGPTLPPTETKP
jgi:hypothetical protein